MDGPIILLILGILALVVIVKFKKKAKPVEVIEETEEELGSDEDLADLKVYYCDEDACDIELEKKQVMTTKSKETCFEVKGFDIKGNKVALKPNNLTWGASCGCSKWGSETGDTNCITCSIRGDSKRNVWVKYKNGVTFTWKIQFI